MTRPVPVPQAMALVALGGATGACLRWAIGVSLPDGSAPHLAATLGINVGGCLLMGLLLVVAVEHRHERLRLLLGTGVLGGFTTYSGFAADTHDLVGRGDGGLGVAYAAATVLLCLLAVAAGRGLGHAVGRERA